MRHVIESVERGSAAYRHGLRAGDALISLNGEAIVDEIDYQALIAGSRVHAVVERDGREVDRKSTRLNSSHRSQSRMPSSA